MISYLRQIITGIEPALLGRISCVCVVCGRTVSNDANPCRQCRDDLPWLQAACTRCGESLETVSGEAEFCNRCQHSPPLFDFCKAVFHYRTPVADLLSAYKFQGKFAAGHAMASCLAQVMNGFYANHKPPQLLVPVPLHNNRLRERGYNQALEISKLVAKSCRLQLDHRAVLRTRDTRPQTDVRGVRARRKNMVDAFTIRANALDNVTSIAVIDDVVTTTATVSALTNALKKSGIQEVHIWCVARASR